MARKQGDGTFTTRPNGTIMYQVSLGYDKSGKRIRKTFYGKTEAECRQKHKDFIKDGEPICKLSKPTKEHTLATWLDIWLSECNKNVTKGTLEDYTNLINHIKKHELSSLNLKDIQKLDVINYFNDKADYSQSFHKRSLYILRAAFEEAIDNELCTANPAARVKPGGVKPTEKTPFTQDEANKILAFAKTDKWFGLSVYIMLTMGIRSGEMRALTGEKFDFENGFLTIDQAVKRGGELGSPKNNKKRTIPLEDDTFAFLSTKIKNDSRYIQGKGETYVTKSSFRSSYLHFGNRLNKYLRSINETEIDMSQGAHVLRHTTSTLWQANGMSRELAAELLGHSSVEVTAGYTHTQMSTMREALANHSILNQKLKATKDPEEL